MRKGRRLGRALLASCASLALAAPARAGDLPEPVVPQGIGVNVHFTSGHEADLDLVAEAGVRVVRMDLFWHATERVRGRYDWSEYDVLTDGLARRGIRPLYILDYSNALYEESIVSTDAATGRERRDARSPERPESVAAFAAWAGAAAAHFRGRRVLWEIWNEPNGFWRPKPDAARYATLARAAAKAIRAADPAATILAPATSGFPWEFLETVFASGLLEDLDAVTVHPYRGTAPETAADDYRRLRGLIERHRSEGAGSLPVLSGEWGYPTHVRGVAEETQAAYLVRQHLSNLLAGVPLSVWYDWKDDGPDPEIHENRFGTVTTALRPKPAWHAMRTMVRRLSGFRVASRLPAGADDAWVLLCVAASGAQTLVAWSTGETRTASVSVGDVPDGSLPTHSMAGTADRAARAEGGVVHVEVDARPRYVALPTPSRALAAEAAWEVDPLSSTLVRSGREDSIRVGFVVRNRFPAPMRVRFALEGEGFDGRSAAEDDVAAGSERRTAIAGPWRRRDVPPRPTVRCDVRIRDETGAWSALRTSRRVVPLDLADPLEVAVAPTVAGFRLEVRDPVGAGLEATARSGTWSRPVATSSDRRVVEVDLPPGIGTPQREFPGLDVVDHRGVLVARAEGYAMTPLAVRGYRALLDGDPDVPGTARVSAAGAPATPGSPAPFPTAWRVDYEFGEGWRFLRLVPDSDSAGIPLPERPRAVGAWVFGDGSDVTLRARVVDSRDQTFQSTGPRVRWKGWRWISIPLDLEDADHWGGPNDGVPRPPLRWECPLLLDGPRTPVAGSVYVSFLSVLHDAGD